MPLTLPDPLATARQEAARIVKNRHLVMDARIERILADSPQLTGAQLTEGVESFHHRRMSMIPSPAKYPEAAPWVDYVLTLDREVQRLAGLTDSQILQRGGN